MTNFNSGFNSNFNPALNPKFNPKLNPNVNITNNQFQNTTGANLYANPLNQPMVEQIENQNKKNNDNLQKQISEDNKTASETFDNIVDGVNKKNIKMNSEVLLKYLRNVMKMPENINKLLLTLESPIIKALIGKNVDTKVLTEILNNNASDAIERVLKAIAESLKSGVKDVNQLKDVLGILNAIQNSASANVVKELLLLYIPVNPPIFDKNIEFKPESKEEDYAIQNSDFSLIFETVNFSNVLCCINSFENTIYLRFFADNSFPFEKIRKAISIFKKEMNYKIEIEENIVKRKKQDKQQTRNFNVVSSGFVPCDVLITAHLVVKTVFKIDETFEN